MAKVATKELLAIDVPCATSEFENDFNTYWDERFQSHELAVTRLPHIPFSQYDTQADLIRDRVKESGKILRHADGLLVINRVAGLILQADRSNLFHMQQGAAMGTPIFLQFPFEEVAPKGAERPADEIYYVGDQVRMIKERLGE